MSLVGGGIGALLTVDNRAYVQTAISKYETIPDLLDGPGTDRTKAPGWKMIRQPQGYILNFLLTLEFLTSDNPDWIHLWTTYKQIATIKQFVPVRLVLPTKDVITQNMYFTLKNISYKMIDRVTGKVSLEPVTINFIAQEGMTLA